MRRFMMTALVAFVAVPAIADDAAILIGNERYRGIDRLVGASEVSSRAQDVQRAGYDVDALVNVEAIAMRQKLADFQNNSKDAERLLVALSGRFATDGGRTWFLAVDVRNPTIFDIEQNAISVDSVLAVLGTLPGKSVLMLGRERGVDGEYDDILRAGIGALDIPQGVTVLMGEPNPVAQFLSDTVIAPGANLVRDVSRTRAVSLHGFRPRSLVMQPSDERVTPQIVDPAAERRAWADAQETDTVAGYQAYLKAYPNGEFSNAASQAISGIQSDPSRADRVIEDRLALTRDERRAIQQNLSILNYDTRGIDGIFGEGTRRAFTNWQQQNGFRQTGYLTGGQIARIEAQAARRSADLEAQAARERAAELRRDRAYWDETGADGTERGLRSYLERYPDGENSDVAQERLAQFEQDRLNTAAQADRDAWARTREADTEVAYQTYINGFRNGAFRDEAQARLRAIRAGQSGEQDQERAVLIENALNLNLITRRLAEAKLEQLGLNPGSVDGNFNDRTRRAIRRFQQSRGLEVTGYLDQRAVVMMLVAQ